MKNNILNLALMALTVVLVAGCTKNEGDDDKDNPLYKEVLINEANIITTTYNDLNSRAISLKSAINTFVNSVNETNLAQAKNAWIATRAPWEQSEGFLFGPVDQEGIDPAMDTWPVDVEAMNNVLNSNLPITAELIEVNEEARGFHLIEFLLWGENGNKTIADFTNRQLEYLQAAATDLQNNTQKLYDAWSSSGGNYADNLLNAGIDNPVYRSQIAALEELVEGLITIADEVANGKIEDPLNSEGNTPNAELEESRFSNNSKLDFADNMRSIQNIYLGNYGSISGKGLTDLVSPVNTGLDNRVKNLISESIQVIEEIPGTFTDAIYNSRPEVVRAQNKVNELLNILESELKPFVNNQL